MYPYTAENIAKYGKPGKNQPFNKALKEIEENPKDISENNSYQVPEPKPKPPKKATNPKIVCSS